MCAVGIGAPRFELGTPCAQGRCATRLRYAPTETRRQDNIGHPRRGVKSVLRVDRVLDRRLAFPRARRPRARKRSAEAVETSQPVHLNAGTPPKAGHLRGGKTGSINASPWRGDSDRALIETRKRGEGGIAPPQANRHSEGVPDPETTAFAERFSTVLPGQPPQLTPPD